ncbi:hypothetical protein TNCT_383601 [Trichonephila clavata]|uniref:Uncharacterized protein n=1 Tax=Trichonephila clavata TaxID=2740835 RepID=A0A8X6GHE7_TRICU|nr:hypothetical protein TNCT_383601 [Trichonephila clavata]
MLSNLKEYGKHFFKDLHAINLLTFYNPQFIYFTLPPPTARKEIHLGAPLMFSNIACIIRPSVVPPTAVKDNGMSKTYMLECMSEKKLPAHGQRNSVKSALTSK